MWVQWRWRLSLSSLPLAGAILPLDSENCPAFRPDSGQIRTPEVMAGLVPAIHVFLTKPSQGRRGGPRKRGHDAESVIST